MFSHWQLPILLLIAVRIAALGMVAPGFSSWSIPWRIRILLVGLLVLPVFCVWQGAPFSFEASLLPNLLLHEAVVGISLGVVPAVMVWGLQLAVQSVHGLSGLPGVTGGEPADTDLAHASALNRFFSMTVLAVFFSTGGHRQLVQAVLESFQWLPPGQYAPLDQAYELLLDLFAQSFALGARAVSPIVVALSISWLAFATMNRILPQLGYFVVGLNLQVLVLLGSLILFLGAVGWVLEGEFANITQTIGPLWDRLAMSR